MRGCSLQACAGRVYDDADGVVGLWASCHRPAAGQGLGETTRIEMIGENLENESAWTGLTGGTRDLFTPGSSPRFP